MESPAALLNVLCRLIIIGPSVTLAECVLPRPARDSYPLSPAVLEESPRPPGTARPGPAHTQQSTALKLYDSPVCGIPRTFSGSGTSLGAAGRSSLLCKSNGGLRSTAMRSAAWRGVAGEPARRANVLPTPLRSASLRKIQKLSAGIFKLEIRPEGEIRRNVTFP